MTTGTLFQKEKPAGDLKVGRGRVLVIAGSDSGGGAGIQADIKTVTALGGYAATAVTALTAQNTEGVFGIYDIPDDFVAQQIRLVLDDLGADAIKTGMLARAGIIRAVAKEIKARAEGVPLVVDPVMVAKGGAPLLAESAIRTLKQQLIPLATVLTPNVPEAELLTGDKIQNREAMEAAAQKLLALGPQAVLLKGGHLEAPAVHDLLMTKEERRWFESPRLQTRHTHGTGCTLASALAAGLAQGLPLNKAVERARRYVYEAIKAAPGFGRGHGPLNHHVRIKD